MTIPTLHNITTKKERILQLG